MSRYYDYDVSRVLKVLAEKRDDIDKAIGRISWKCRRYDEVAASIERMPRSIASYKGKVSIAERSEQWRGQLDSAKLMLDEAFEREADFRDELVQHETELQTLLADCLKLVLDSDNKIQSENPI